MITRARVGEIIGQLEAAGAGWADVARRLPEFQKLNRGVPSGPGLVRPWVFLADEIEDYEAPPRLVRHENGVWFLKGTPYRDIEEKT